MIIIKIFLFLFLAATVISFIHIFSDKRRIEILAAMLRGMDHWYIKTILKFTYGTTADGKNEKFIVMVDIAENKVLSLLAKINSVGKSKALSVVGLMAARRSTGNLLSISYLIFGSILYVCLPFFVNDVEIDIRILIGIGVLILVIAADQFIFTFRIRKGLYGSNRHDAEEIINFILANAEHTDQFKGPNGKLRIFDPIPDVEAQSQPDFESGVNPAY